MLLQPTNDCYIPHFQPTEFGAHISSYTQLLSGSSDYCVTAPQLLNLDEPSHLNAQPTTQIHVAQYHAENGLPNKVVGDFNDNEYKILAINDDNNINDNDNDVYFFFQSTTTENVYRSYTNCVDVCDNQVPKNSDYRLFLDLPQQSES